MITFQTLGQPYSPKNKKNLKDWIKTIIENHGKKVGNITYVFCSDETLLEMNNKYLHHNTLTDILTFDYSEKNILSGDICISVDTVKTNAIEFKTEFEHELHRVMIHGILHLMGNKDKTKEEKERMRCLEDECLKLYNV